MLRRRRLVFHDPMRLNSHPELQQEGYLVRGGLRRRAVWCVLNGSVMAVYQQRDDPEPQFRLDAYKTWLSDDLRTLRVENVTLRTENTEDFYRWARCFEAVKPRSFDSYYALQSILSEGPGHKMFLARSKQSGQFFETKVVDLRKRSVRRQLPQLLKEANIGQAFDCRFLLRTVDVFTTKIDLRFVYEHMDLGNLHELMLRQHLSETMVRWLLRHTINGVKHLHAHGVVHGNICLSSIYIKSNRVDANLPLVKLADFSLASFLPSQSLYHDVGCKEGPLLRQKEETRATAMDMLALGVVAFEMLVGFGHVDYAKLKAEIASGKGAFHGTDSAVGPSVLVSPELWESLSDDARSFTEGLLTPDIDQRLTAAQALSHPFLAERTLARAFQRSTLDVEAFRESSRAPVHTPRAYSRASDVSVPRALSTNSFERQTQLAMLNSGSPNLASCTKTSAERRVSCA